MSLDPGLVLRVAENILELQLNNQNYVEAETVRDAVFILSFTACLDTAHRRMLT